MIPPPEILPPGPPPSGPPPSGEALRRRNRRVLAGTVAAVAVMTGLSFAAVPLYSLFCRATGFGGTTQVAATVGAVTGGRVADRPVTVRFDAVVNRDLDWAFRPSQTQVTVRPGEATQVSYRARNRGTTPVVGTATFNVTPDKAGVYFDKVQCFCFTRQRLEPGQEVELPVVFFIDPAIADDRGMDDVKTITLSYTFFRAADQTAGPPSAAPDGG